jgi:hypothetical protein
LVEVEVVGEIPCNSRPMIPLDRSKRKLGRFSKKGCCSVRFDLKMREIYLDLIIVGGLVDVEVVVEIAGFLRRSEISREKEKEFSLIVGLDKYAI